jgi:hypothetical protein
MGSQKKVLSTLLLIVVVLFSSCAYYFEGTIGSGNIVKEEIIVGNFNSINLAASADVEIVKGSKLEVTLSDYENLIDLWDIKVVNNTLIVQTKPFTSISNTKALVTVVIPENLYELKVTGSGEIAVLDSFEMLEEAAISGSGKISGNVPTEYNALKLNISGSGSIALKGKVSNLKTTTTGSGKFYLSDLEAKEVICTVSGSGNTYVNALEYLDVLISGSGDVYYSGNPIIEVQATGSGRLRHQ